MLLCSNISDIIINKKTLKTARCHLGNVQLRTKMVNGEKGHVRLSIRAQYNEMVCFHDF